MKFDIKTAVKKFKNKDFLIQFFVLIIIIIGLGFLINTFSNNREYYGNNNNNNNNNKLVYYYMNGCGHCKNFTPEWSKFVSNNSSNYNCTFEKIEANDAPNDINGYPTVILIKSNNDKVTFNGERTEQGLTQFLDNNL